MTGESYREALGPYKDLVEAGLQMVVAEASLRFLRSAEFDDQLELSLWLTRLGNTSMTTNLAVRKAGEVLVEVVVRYVFVDAAKRIKAPMPQQVRDRLAPFLLVDAESDAPLMGALQPARVIVLSGLPGTGKTRLAESIGSQLEVPVFSVAWLLGALAECSWRFGLRRRASPSPRGAHLDVP